MTLPRSVAAGMVAERCAFCGTQVEMSAFIDKRGRFVHGLALDGQYHFCGDALPAPRTFYIKAEQEAAAAYFSS